VAKVGRFVFATAEALAYLELAWNQSRWCGCTSASGAVTGGTATLLPPAQNTCCIVDCAGQTPEHIAPTMRQPHMQVGWQPLLLRGIYQSAQAAGLFICYAALGIRW